MKLSYLWITMILLRYISAVVLDFETDLLAIPNDHSQSTLRHNTHTLSAALQLYASGNKIVIPKDKTFHLIHGVYGSNIRNSIIEIDGVLKFERGSDEKKKSDILTDENSLPVPCIHIEDSYNITLTSSNVIYDETSSSIQRHRGLIDGGGPAWWGIPYIGYTKLREHRPVLLTMNRSKTIVIEHIIFQDAPFYTLDLMDIDDLIIRYSSIVARRTKGAGHSVIDLSAFNTDGIDVSGHNVHVHDVDIWNQDDCIAVKDASSGLSSNMLFERIHASGLGLVIGSIGGSTVRNITFRDSLVYQSYKGIYMKFRVPENNKNGIIENVLFQNITIEEPIQWGIWIGPAQQSISSNICKPHPCSLCWPHVPLSQCYPLKQGKFKNITLRDVRIHNPKGSPGVILADDLNPIDGIVFENVAVTRGKRISFLDSVFTNNDSPPYFSGLDQPINDHRAWINRFYIYIALLLVALLLVSIALLFLFLKASKIYFCSKSPDDVMKRKFSDDVETTLDLMRKNKSGGQVLFNQKRCEMKRFLMQFILLGIAIILASSMHHIVMVTAQLSDSGSFYVCEGVMHGVARGKTWPVPSCFQDITEWSNETLYRYNISNKFLALVLEIMLSSLCIFLLAQSKEEWSTGRNRGMLKLLSCCNFLSPFGGRRSSAKYDIVERLDSTRTRTATEDSYDTAVSQNDTDDLFNI